MGEPLLTVGFRKGFHGFIRMMSTLLSKAAFSGARSGQNLPDRTICRRNQESVSAYRDRLQRGLQRRQYVFEVFQHIVNVLIRQAGMQRKRYFIMIHFISVRIITDGEAELFVSGMHGKRLVMDVGRNLPFRQLGNQRVTLFQRFSVQTDKIQMPAGLIPVALMRKHVHIHIPKALIVPGHDIPAAGKNTGVPFQLRRRLPP